jgi:hypothetical protein
VKRGDVARVCNAARKLKDLRDFITHGTWGVGTDSATLSTYKYGHLQDLVDHDLDAESLESIARQIAAINGRLWQWRDALSEKWSHPQPPFQPADR